MGFPTFLRVALAPDARAAALKDRIEMALCLRPVPGPITVQRTARDVSGPSTVAVYVHAVAAGADGTTLRLDGDGPFDPNRNGQTLTCRR